MTTSSVTDFFTSNDINGALSPEQAAQLLELAAQGDTGAAPDNGGVPATTTATDTASETAAANESNSETNNQVQAPAAAAPAPEPAAAPATEAAPAPGAAEPDPANAVILAKDGKHTIAYQKLVDAREGERHWKGVAEQAQQQLAQLQTEAAQRAADGQAPTKTDNAVAQATAAIEQGVDPAIFGDFSDQALAKGIATLVQAQVAAMVEPMRADVESVKQSIAPLQQTAVKTANQLHYEAIYSRHPDANSMLESQELAQWIGAQPTFVQDAYRQVLEKGTAGQVVELFDNFKKATQPPAAAPAPTPDPKSAATAAKAVTAAAAPAVPTSLSDIPGGRVEGRSPHEQLAAKSAVEMVDAMSSMTPAQIEAFLNRGL